MSQVTILRGVPASGKSHYATAQVKNAKGATIRVNRDDLRYQMFGSYWGAGVDEDTVTRVANAMIVDGVKHDKDVIVDATNLVSKNLRSIADLVHKHGGSVSIMDFPVDMKLAIVRDKFRELKGEHFVGPDVIEKSFFDRFHINKETGKLPKAPDIDNKVSIEYPQYVEVPGLPYAIIVDIDGTLADLSHRSPYAKDEALYLKDKLNDYVSGIVALYQEGIGNSAIVILMSGREEKFRDVTNAWLLKHGVENDALYMRATGDPRNDSIIKNELFEKYIAGKYNIDFILDDRLRVCQMWYAKGLNVLRVGDPDADF